MYRRVIGAMIAFFILVNIAGVFFASPLYMLSVSHVLWGQMLLCGLIAGCTYYITKEVGQLKDMLAEKIDENPSKENP